MLHYKIAVLHLFSFALDYVYNYRNGIFLFYKRAKKKKKHVIDIFCKNQT